MWFGARQPLNFVLKFTAFVNFDYLVSIFHLHFPHFKNEDNNTCP